MSDMRILLMALAIGFVWNSWVFSMHLDRIESDIAYMKAVFVELQERAN